MAKIETTGYAAIPRNPVYSIGKDIRVVVSRAALVSASMSNGDVLELAQGLTFGDRIDMVFTPNASPALTAAIDAKLGFFQKADDGTLSVIATGSDALLWNGVTLAAALSTRDLLMGLNASLDTTKNIGELLSLGADSEPRGGVVLGLTFPTKPSVNGTLDLRVHVEQATTN